MEPAYYLPSHLRGALKTPLGTLYPGNTIKEHIHKELEQLTEKIITVGDVITENIHDSGVDIDLAIIDQKTKRTYKTPITLLPEHQPIKINNPPATITRELINTIGKTLKQNTKTLIIVDGEEDLATLPAILLSPPNSIVLYGQPDEGAVLIRVDETIKQKIQKLLDKMEQKTHN